MLPLLIEQITRYANLHWTLPVAPAFLSRLEEGGLTRDENSQSHFCVYFAAYDPTARQVFIGHHKKSGLWLFNGGHIDRGETCDEALWREMSEEWGFETALSRESEPGLLTITEIDNPAVQTCTRHYDIWYFIPVSKSAFRPKKSLLEKEFHCIQWLTLDQTRTIVTDANTCKALSFIERGFMDGMNFLLK